MTADYAYFLELAQKAQPPADGILLAARCIKEDEVKAVLFGFAAGQELSEHTAAKAGLLWFVQGQALVGLGSDQKEVVAGAWVQMRAGLTPNIMAKTPVVMPLVLLKQAAKSKQDDHRQRTT